MASIHEAAAQGRLLTLEDLDNFRKSATNTFDIDELDKKGRTPLSYAAQKGHVDVVKLLVNEGADVNKLSGRNRSALWHAAAGPMPRQSRLDILTFLIDKGAGIDSPADDGSTPLMKAIPDRDADIIRFLVDHGASTKLKRADGLDAHKIAEMTADPKVMNAVKSRSQRAVSRGVLIDKILEFILFVIAAVNFFIFDVVGGAVKQLFSIEGRDSPEIRQAVQMEEKIATAEEFNEKMNSYLADTGLSEFFADGDNFLQDVASKGLKLKNDPENPLRKDRDIRDLTFLALYQPVIYCDDSTSMLQGSRAEDQRALVQRIARITTRLVPDGYGTSLQFINHVRDLDNTLSAAQVGEIMSQVRPRGNTKIGTNLKLKILDPLVYNVLNQQGGKLERPIIVSCITDGSPNAESSNTFKKTILDCISFIQEKGYEEAAVRFQISQIGNDPDAEEFLAKLQEDDALSNVLYCTTGRLDDQFRQLHENEEDLERWLLKTLMGPISGSDG